MFAYAHIADVAQCISANPNRDLQGLYARMVFNVVTHNVDDHLKTTGFLHEPCVRDAYRLSPLNDVVTQEGSLKHMLRIGQHGRESTLKNALSVARRMRCEMMRKKKLLDECSMCLRSAAYYAKAEFHTKRIEAGKMCFSWMERRPVIKTTSPALSTP